MIALQRCGTFEDVELVVRASKYPAVGVGLEGLVAGHPAAFLPLRNRQKLQQDDPKPPRLRTFNT